MFSGYLKAIYFTEEPFTASVEQIQRILLQEIDCVVDLAMPKEKTRNFIKTIDQFIFTREHTELAIIQCRYPFKLDIKISLFGRKNLVRKAKRQLQSIIDKHTLQTFWLRMNASQVCAFLNLSHLLH